MFAKYLVYLSSTIDWTAHQFSSAQSLSRVWLFATPWTAACQASLSITNSQSLLKLMSIESMMPFNHLILSRPLLLLPSITSSIRVFSSESVLCIRWPKYWRFSFSISPSNEYSGLISFRIDWLDLLAVQRTLKSLLQHQSSKASVLRRSAFFIVQLSHPYMTTGKTIALTRRTFVGKVMSLLFNMLSRLVIAFLPKKVSFHFMAAVTICSDFGASQNKIYHCFHCFPIYLPWSQFSECWVLSQLFHCPLSLSSRGSLVLLRFLPLGWCHLHIWGYWYFSQQFWFQLVLHPGFHMMYSACNLNKRVTTALTYIYRITHVCVCILLLLCGAVYQFLLF